MHLFSIPRATATTDIWTFYKKKNICKSLVLKCLDHWKTKAFCSSIYFHMQHIIIIAKWTSQQ